MLLSASIWASSSSATFWSRHWATHSFSHFYANTPYVKWQLGSGDIVGNKIKSIPLWIWSSNWAKWFVLILSGYHNNIPWTGRFQQQKFMFSQFWKLGSSKSRCGQSQFLAKRSFWLAEDCLLATSSQGRERGGKLSAVFSYKSIHLRVRPHSHDLIYPDYLSKDLSPNTVTLGVGAST